MTKVLSTLICGLFLTSCYFGDNPMSDTHLVKDFTLFWFDSNNNQQIICRNDNDPNSGALVIEQNVFAVGYEDSFIIAKQLPSNNMEVQDGNIIKRNEKGDIRIEFADDTLNLPKEDSIYKEHGFLYRTKKKFSIINSVKSSNSSNTNSRTIYFHIIDIRKYDKTKWDSYRVYTFDNEQEFLEKKKALGVSNNLVFTINNPPTKSDF